MLSRACCQVVERVHGIALSCGREVSKHSYAQVLTDTMRRVAAQRPAPVWPVALLATARQARTRTCEDVLLHLALHRGRRSVGGVLVLITLRSKRFMQ